MPAKGLTGAAVNGNALLLFIKLLSLLPIDWCSAVGYRLGTIVGPRNPIRDARVRHNLAILRPDLAAPDVIDATVRRFWGDLGRIMTEFAVLDRIYRSGRIKIVGAEHLEAARATGRPRIGLFVHLGNWEVIAQALDTLDENWRQVAQPLVNPYRYRIAVDGRKRHAARYIVPGVRAGGQILNHLRENGLLSLAGDEYLKGELLAPSFGRPVRLDGNLGRIVRLAKTANALICPYFCTRTKGARFQFNILPAIELEWGGAAEIQKGAERLDAVITEIVVAHIDQWLMLDNFELARD
jgi:KDO2-lipid IV(A) lauroyltransferase